MGRKGKEGRNDEGWRWLEGRRGKRGGHKEGKKEGEGWWKEEKDGGRIEERGER